VTNVTAYGIGYDLNLFSNFTFFLDDPEHGDQFHQADHRFISGGRLSHRRIGRWMGHASQTTFGGQLRNDSISKVGLYHTEARRQLETIREDAVRQTSGGLFVQSEIEWTPWLRTLGGLRGDAYHSCVDAGEPANGGHSTAGLVSPKGGVVVGPFSGTELYVDAGFGFHSNDARGAIVSRDPAATEQSQPATPLVRAKGAEVGVRTVAVPHLQTSVSVWSLALESELVFVGDAGTTQAGRPSRRYGIEWANYYRLQPWLVLDGDLSISRGSFTDRDGSGDRIPGAVENVMSLGASVTSLRNIFGSVRPRYFGARPLVEDNSVRSKPTTLVNLEAGYKLTRTVRLALDVFNLLDARDSDVDYYYTSRLRGEPIDGISDIHLHPALPRTARIMVAIGF
jgi:outer membrane receptor protein involved in Fe transport